MTFKIVGEIYCSSLFKYEPETKTFSGNYSDVPGCLRQLSSDDFTAGFGIRSIKTGRVIFFVLFSAEEIDNGKMFIFASTNEKMPDLQAKITFLPPGETNE
jgi:hypothetical protein